MTLPAEQRGIPPEEVVAEQVQPVQGDAVQESPELDAEAQELKLEELRKERAENQRFDGTKEEAKTIRDSGLELQGIARSVDYFKNFGERAPQSLANVLESKKCFEFKKAGGERPAETIATEILHDIEPLIQGLQKELEGSGLTPEQVKEGILSIREVLYTVVTKEILSGGKVKDLLGTIHYQDQPDATQTGEAYGQRTDPAKIKGMSVFNEQTGRFDIYFYGGFFKGSEKGRSKIARHEFSHVLAEGTNLFDAQVYAKFISYAGNTEISDEQIAEIGAKAPELAEILSMMRNPEASKGVWDGYIRSRIEKLATLSDEDLVDERKAVASELVAEMIAPYLESGESEMGYLAKRFETLDQDKLLEMLLSQAKKPDGALCQNGHELAEFCRARGVEIDVANATPQDLINSLSSLPEFAAVFGANQKFFNKLKGSFENRGQAIQADPRRQYRHEEDELSDYDEMMDFSEYYDEYHGSSGPSGGKMGKSAGPPKKDFFSSFWDFITNKNAKPAAPKSATPAVAAPGQMPKAA